MIVEIDREEDGRWIAEIPTVPGALSYGDTRDEAVARVEALVLRALADRVEHGEAVEELEIPGVKARKPAIATSFLIVALGLAWLLNVVNPIPGVDWIWVIALGISGILLLTTMRLDRFNFVAGLSLIVSSILAVLRQTGKLSVSFEAPVLFITVGVLIFLAQFLPLPPETSAPDDESKTGDGKT